VATRVSAPVATSMQTLDAAGYSAIDRGSWRLSASSVARRPDAVIRVAHCISTMRIGGTELNAARTIERLDRARFDPIVLTFENTGPLIARYRAANVPVIAFSMPNLYGPRAIAQAMRLAIFLRRARVDIVHAHDIYANMFVAVPSRIARVRALVLSRRWWQTFPQTKHRLANRVAYRLAHRVLANSPSVARSLTTSDGVAAHRITVVPNFVDDAAFEAPPSRRNALLEELGIPFDARVIGVVARLDPIKEHETLLRAAAILTTRWPKVHVVIVGDGENRNALEQLCKELGIQDRVHFAGYRPNLPNLNHAFEVAVLCSRSEGFPNTIVEAMAAGRPVVASDVGGNADAVLDGETGFLAPAGDAPAFARALDVLFGDRALADRMGEAARRRARAEFHATSALPRLEALYDSLIGVGAPCTT